MPFGDVRSAASRATALSAISPADRRERVFDARCAWGRAFFG